jgi:hypothetical protein
MDKSRAIAQDIANFKPFGGFSPKTGSRQKKEESERFALGAAFLT